MYTRFFVRVVVAFTSILLFVVEGRSQFPAWHKVFDGQGLSVGINPLNPRTIYAQGNDNLLYVSRNGGASWSSLPVPLPNQLREILIHPNDTLTIFVADFFNGLRKSTDGGMSWSLVISSYGIDGESISCDPIHPDTMYAGNFGDASVYRSTNRGSTWTLQGHAGSGILCGLIVRPDSSSILYAGTGAGTISKSTDSGITWHLVKSGGSDEVPKFAINPSNPLVGYATGYEGTLSAQGLWKTTDGGEHWFLTPLQQISVWSLDIDHQHPDTLYVGTFSEPNAGIYRTTDGGTTWTLLNKGFISTNAMWNLKIDQQADTNVYIGVTYGDFGADAVFRLENANAGFEGVVRDSLTGGPIATGSIAFTPSGSSVPLDMSGGNYSFYRFAGDTSGSQSFTVTINGSPFELGTVTLTNDSLLQRDILVQPASISGTLFDDLNHNGVRDSGEPGLGNRNVLLGGQTSRSVATDTAGRFTFVDLFPGTDTVAAQSIFGWRLTSASPSYTRSIDLSHKNFQGNDFGFHRNLAVASVLPLPNSVGNPASTSITVTFDTAVNTSGFNDTSSFIVTGSASGRHRGSFNFSGGNTTATFLPNKPFAPGEEVTVEATERIQTMAGDSVFPYVFHFSSAVRRSPGTFAPKVDYGVGNNPWGVAVGDLNGDGLPDIVTANMSSNSVSVLINQHNGLFAPKADYTVGSGPRSVALADFNGDGLMDIATANGGASTVSVLINNGDGTFAPKADYPGGSSPIAVVAVDLDGDGHPDLVTTDVGSGNISILMNNGSGVFSLAGSVPAGVSPWAAVRADINGDGGDDILVGNSVPASSIETFLNIGGGGVASSTSYPVGGFVRSVAAADLNGDGFPDLVATNSASGSVSWYPGTGGGAFGVRSDIPAGPLPWGLAIGDIDGDGRPDILVTNSGTDSVSVFRNLGGGSFGRTDYQTGSGPRAVALGDLDGDGVLDMVVANTGTNTISILQNSTSVTTAIDSSWNLISLPVRSLASQRPVLYPSSISPAFVYSSGYVNTDSIAPGAGFWLKFASAGPHVAYGDSIMIDTIAVNARWNLIGSLTAPIPVGSITTIPSGILTGSFFGYSGSYIPADTIFPGRGYWVKSTAAGLLIMNSSGAGILPRTTFGASLHSFSSLTLRDAAGRFQRLYFSIADSSGNDDRFELPPLPPEGAFDARFAGNSICNTIPEGGRSETPLSLSGARYPVTVEWNATPMAPVASLMIGTKIVPMSGSGSFRIITSGQDLKLALSGRRDLPAEFALDQNYPNPFNPATTVRYALPEDARVRIDVYDAVGRHVNSLIDGFRSAGYQSVRWDASSAASGVYYIRLEAVPVRAGGRSFVQVRKMLLMK